ncbi:MAG: putative molybdenum carrier protein [Alphaproteobacteria bacterium]
MRVKKIISGGQTGADRAALDVAIELGVPHGGWCTFGRQAEDGRIDGRYQLKETPEPNAALRTEWNVRDSDATLVVAHGVLAGGAELSIRKAQEYNKPCLHIDLANLSLPDAARKVNHWITEEVNDNSILNVAGPRQSEDPKIYFDTMALISSILLPQTNKMAQRNLDIAVQLRAQAQDNYRHWERLLHLTPYAIFALAGAAAIIKSQLGFQTTLLRDGLTGVGIATMLALFHMCQLIRRHNKQVVELKKTIEKILPFNLANTLLTGIPEAYGPSLIHRPQLFAQKFLRFDAPALYYFMACMLGIGIWAFATAHREWILIALGLWALAAIWFNRKESNGV